MSRTRRFRAALTFATERFLMRPEPARVVARETFPWGRDPEVMEALHHTQRDWKPRQWWRMFRRYDNRHEFVVTIRLKEDGRLIGYHSIRVSGNAVAFVGVVVGDRSWWGRAVVAETRGALIDVLFEKLEMRRIWGTPFARNFPSVFNYQKLGFTHEGVLREHAKDGTDMIMFGMLRSEWMARKAAHG
jgi:RimJ/RimL family protein N-acetyltransferase